MENDYPRDLIPIIRRACKSMRGKPYHRAPPLPDDSVMLRLLDVAYHASMGTEEGRRPALRLILYSPDDHKKSFENGKARSRYFDLLPRLLSFDTDRPFTTSELIRLSPAADMRRFLVCVKEGKDEEHKPSLRIWGMLDMGANWWKFVHHESSGGMPPPNHITITTTGPGELSVSAQGDVFASIKAGQISTPNVGALWHGPLDDFLAAPRKQLYKDVVSRLRQKKWDKEGHDDEYPHRFYNFFLERILFYTRLRGHGGTLLVIPSYLKKDDTRLADRLHIKYPTRYEHAWDLLIRSLVNHSRYFDLHFPLWDAKIRLTKDRFREYHMLESEGDELDEAIQDVSRAIASLTAVDGAVLMTDHFDVLGFGVEVLAPSPSLTSVQSRTGSRKAVEVPVESFGTRHRSAFRFCSSFEDAIGFVVSHDGGVKAVKRVGRDVVLWPDINSGGMGI